MVARLISFGIIQLKQLTFGGWMNYFVLVVVGWAYAHFDESYNNLVIGYTD